MKKFFLSLLVVLLLSFITVPTTALSHDKDDFMWRIPTMIEEDVVEKPN